MLIVAVARSSPGGVAIHCVVPVLWMTVMFSIMGPVARHEVGVETETSASIPVRFCSAMKTKYSSRLVSSGTVYSAVVLLPCLKSVDHAAVCGVYIQYS